MPDQAHDLRQLATHCSRAESPRCSDRPALVVVAGGKGGVGTTTVALGLAAAVARTGKRTLLLEADPRGGDIALLCGIEERYTLADVLAGRRTWDEATYAGPQGVGVVVGQRGWHDCQHPAVAAGQLLEQLDHRNVPAQLIVVDAGSAFTGSVPHVCCVASAVIMVTTSNAASVVGTFAGIKTLVSMSRNGSRLPPLFLLVNMATTAHVAKTVSYRLARTCRRMLGVELQTAGQVATARPARPNSRGNTIGLNLQVTLADTIRGVLVAKALAN
jgi:flagellar biosynthesis protein FlhG